MNPGEQTRAVHGPAFPSVPQTPVGVPVYRSAAFSFEGPDDYAEVMNGRAPGYSYSRVDNPTSDHFARAVAALEGARVDGEVVGQPFSSGMAAISTTLMALTRAGSHVVAPREVYGGTYGLLVDVLARFGVETTFVDARDLDAVRAAVRDETTVLYGEVMANPTMTVSDLPGLAAVAREAGAVFVVDATFASPAVCRPLEHGVDVVLHSATKYLGGHSDATGGVAVGRPDLLARIRHDRIELGGMLAPDEAFLLHRGLATLPLRVDRACRSALAVAAAVADHPAVASVRHPGLATDPSHELAVKLFDEGRYGACVTLTPRGGREGGTAFCAGLRLAENATSLGGVRTKVSHAATSTHRQLDDAALAAAGIDPGAVRVSIGLEDPEDLVTDVLQALDRL